MTRGASALGCAMVALGITACTNPPKRNLPDPPPPRTAAKPVTSKIAVAAKPIGPLSADGMKTCLSWHQGLENENANLEIMDRQVNALRQSIDAEEQKLTDERARVDTRHLQEVKDYGRHVEDNRKRIQAWNAQVDAYNARVETYNQDMRTFDSSCASRMNRNSLGQQTAKGATRPVPTPTR